MKRTQINRIIRIVEMCIITLEKVRISVKKYTNLMPLLVHMDTIIPCKEMLNSRVEPNRAKNKRVFANFYKISIE